LTNLNLYLRKTWLTEQISGCCNRSNIMDNNVSAKEFEVYQQSIDDMLNVIQLIIDEEWQRNIQQDLRIKDIQDQLDAMS